MSDGNPNKAQITTASAGVIGAASAVLTGVTAYAATKGPWSGQGYATRGSELVRSAQSLIYETRGTDDPEDFVIPDKERKDFADFKITPMIATSKKLTAETSTFTGSVKKWKQSRDFFYQAQTNHEDAKNLSGESKQRYLNAIDTRRIEAAERGLQPPDAVQLDPRNDMYPPPIRSHSQGPIHYTYPTALPPIMGQGVYTPYRNDEHRANKQGNRVSSGSSVARLPDASHGQSPSSTYSAAHGQYHHHPPTVANQKGKSRDIGDRNGERVKKTPHDHNVPAKIPQEPDVYSSSPYHGSYRTPSSKSQTHPPPGTQGNLYPPSPDYGSGPTSSMSRAHPQSNIPQGHFYSTSSDRGINESFPLEGGLGSHPSSRSSGDLSVTPSRVHPYPPANPPPGDLYSPSSDRGTNLAMSRSGGGSLQGSHPSDRDRDDRRVISSKDHLYPPTNPPRGGDIYSLSSDRGSNPAMTRSSGGSRQGYHPSDRGRDDRSIGSSFKSQPHPPANSPQGGYVYPASSERGSTESVSRGGSEYTAWSDNSSEYVTAIFCDSSEDVSSSQAITTTRRSPQGTPGPSSLFPALQQSVSPQIHKSSSSKSSSTKGGHASTRATKKQGY